MNRNPNFDFYSFNQQADPDAPKSEPTPAPQAASAPREQTVPPPFTPVRPDPDAVRTTRRAFSRVGWAFVGMMVVWYAAATLIDPYLRAPSLPSWLPMLASTLPLYLVGIPTLLLLTLGLPRTAPQKQSFGPGAFAVALTAAFLGLLAGSIMGNTVMSTLSVVSGYSFDNMVEQMFDVPFWLSTLLTVVLAPVFEELIFRKLLIDRLVPYGEWTALLVPALLFGAMHGNFYQFFYAVAVGLVFGYVYLRSGKWWLGVALHAAVNLICGVFPSYIQTLIDLDAFSEQLSNMTDPAALLSYVSEHLAGFGLLLVYDLILYGAATAGVILLIVHRRRIRLEPQEKELPRGFRTTTALLNSGVIAGLVLCAAMFLLSLVTTATPL